jgi:hypothetical protein
LKYFSETMTIPIKRLLLCAGIVLLSACAASAAPPVGKQADYFAGVYLLQANAGIPDSVRAGRYRELEAMTGITAVQAGALLRQYRPKPAEWKMVYDSIFVRLARTPPPPPAALRDSVLKPLIHKKRR